MKRREFLKRSAGYAAGTGFLIGGCSKAKDIDLLIINGTVYDGSGAPGVAADVAVAADKIVAVEPSINQKRALVIIDAKGMAVSPGFIDPHTHTDIHLIVNPKAESKIRQGVTTEIGGNCGDSWYPVPDADFEESKEQLKEQYNLDLTWRDMNGFFSRLGLSGSALNFGTLIGNGTLRSYVLGPYDRLATQEEMARMKSTLEDCMKAGAFGLSSGLEYAPSSFASTEELIELSRVVTAYNGIYATHMRSEDDKLFEAIDEAVRISRESGASLQISHFKACYKPNWDKLDGAFARVEAAQQELGHVLVDRYSYHAFSTGLSMFFPMWAKDGTGKDFIARLKDPTNDGKLRAYFAEREAKFGTWENVLISGVRTDANKDIVGKTLLAAAGERGKPCYEFARDLLIDEENRVSIIGFAMSEENLKKVIAHPLSVIGSDGNSLAPYGPLSEGIPHPRSYGTFPRVLGKFVREEKVLTLEEAIAKMSGRTADKFGIEGRGYIRQGNFADIVVFNPDTVIDKATWSNPHTYPEGIGQVIVNGRVVVKDGEHTGELPGRVLKKTTA